MATLPALSAAETRAAEALLARAWGTVARWPEAVIAAYPALARPGSAQVQVPDFWQPEV